MERREYDTSEFITDVIAVVIVGFLLGAGLVGYFLLQSHINDLMRLVFVLLISGIIGSIIGLIILITKIIKNEPLWDDEDLNNTDKTNRKEPGVTVDWQAEVVIETATGSLCLICIYRFKYVAGTIYSRCPFLVAWPNSAVWGDRNINYSRFFFWIQFVFSLLFKKSPCFSAY